MDRNAALIKLNELDRKVRALERKIADRTAGLSKETQRVADAGVALETVREQVKRLQMEVDRRGVLLKTAEEGVKKLEGQLMSLKTNEEYAAMQKQIVAKGTEIGELEERILEAMEVVESAKGAIAEREAGLVDAKRALADAEAQAEKDAQENAEQILELKARWEGIAKEAHGGSVGLYKTIRDRMGDGIARIGGDRMCQGCHVAVTVQILNRALGDSLVQCPNCDRILVPIG